MAEQIDKTPSQLGKHARANRWMKRQQRREERRRRRYDIDGPAKRIYSGYY